MIMPPNKKKTKEMGFKIRKRIYETYHIYFLRSNTMKVTIDVEFISKEV